MTLVIFQVLLSYFFNYNDYNDYHDYNDYNDYNDCKDTINSPEKSDENKTK